MNTIIPTFILLISILSISAENKRDKRFEGLTENEIHSMAEKWDDDDIDEGLVDDMDLPEYKREKRQPDMDMVMKDPKLLDQPPEQEVKRLKQHRTLMMFVDVVEKDYWLAKPEPRTRPWSTKKFSDEISGKWEVMLHNSHELGIMRFQPDDDQILFKLDDGARAYAIKDFLVEQEEVIHVSIEKTDYWGKGDEIVNYRKYEEEKKKKKDRDDAIRKIKDKKMEEIKKRREEEKKKKEEEEEEKKMEDVKTEL